MSPPPSPTTHILVSGAREHNLQGVDVALPRDSLDVITGLSGSGKSSLAFDTIYQEGQRRYLESLSAYARQFLGKMEKPRVERVEGLSPTLAIVQRSLARNPRSTVGTVTEITDFFRLWMARLGTPHCPECGRRIEALSPSRLADRLLIEHEGLGCTIMAPVVRERKGEYRKEIEELQAEGFVRARVDGVMRLLEEPIPLARYEKHTLEVVTDRVRLVRENRDRLLEALELALKKARGVVSVLLAPGGPEAPERHAVFATGRACPEHDVYLPEMEPRLFSFNAPQGACPRCEGLGALEGFDPEALFEREAPACRACRAMPQGHLPFSSTDQEMLAFVLTRLGANPESPFHRLDPEVRRGFLFGEPGIEVRTRRLADGRDVEFSRPWEGVLPILEEVWRYTRHAPLEPFRRRVACPECRGERLNPIARGVEWRGRTLPGLVSLPVVELRAFFEGATLEGAEAILGAEMLREIRHRLRFLDAVGLGYLSLDRPTLSLSGGESQRIRLAAQVGSGLQGVTYVLDEPSIGLHPRDHRRLLDTLMELRDRGNTVIVVEHDAETMRAADHIVEIGPGAGRAGGRLVAEGSPARFLAQPSLSADYLTGRRQIPIPRPRRAGNGLRLRVHGARANNLRGIDIEIPLGQIVVITGVSGSGKSTLLLDVLAPTLQAAMGGHREGPRGCDGLEGVEHIDKVVHIDQEPIGRTPRSNPATYTGAMDGIRGLFAAEPAARARGYKAGRFSFNVPGGRCEACQGAGVQVLEMQFLADVEVPCERCEGRRFNPETLEVRWKGRNIREILDMTVSEASAFFSRHRVIHRPLAALERVGLGYLALGQPSTTLSGGEAQRVKLATELQRPPTGRTLYLLDEPTTGLHFADVERLLDALGELRDAGNSLVIVEHNVDVMKVADHILDLGPGGGSEGGLVVGQGSPEEIATLDTATGRVLAELLRPQAPALAATPRAPRAPVGEGEIRVFGARRHNLKGVNVALPKGRITVVTGVSGSGKSSLAMHTLFAEGQRRYVESLSTYARRFLGRPDRADVDAIEGLSPAIAIGQGGAHPNPRSTVATTTEIHDLLRLLWARLGQPRCPACARPLRALEPSTAATLLAEEDPGPGRLATRLSPVGDAPAKRDELCRDGFGRLHDPETRRDLELGEPEALDALGRGAWLVLDRFDPARTPAERVAEAVARAWTLGADTASFFPSAAARAPIPLPRDPVCPEHGAFLNEPISPRCFSFNSRVGACPECDGLGERRNLDLQRLLPRPQFGLLSAMDGRVSALIRMNPRLVGTLEAVLRGFGLDLDTPVETWPDEARRAVLEGQQGPLDVSYDRLWGATRASVREKQVWKGILDVLNGWESPLEWLHRASPCSECGGKRLKRLYLAVVVGGIGIGDLCALTVEAAIEFFRSLSLSPQARRVVEQLLPDLLSRLGFLRDVGLGYLSLDRPTHTLSGGETQRIRLASQLGSRLTDTLYVLDEPTVGLHPRDTDRLLHTLEGLRDLGNTVVVVEHDLDTIRRADFVVELGPGAGSLGGELVATGTPAEIAMDPRSLTGAWLSGQREIPIPERRRVGGPPILMRGCRRNNLKGVSVGIPTAALVVVTGVSGSGKSSLIMDSLRPAVAASLRGDTCEGEGDCEVQLPPGLDRLVVVDGTPIGRSPRSCPATYTRVMDGLRKLFARLPGAQTRGLGPDAFSFNAAGRCPVCEGRGALQVEMHFLSDVWIPCDACGGRRFHERTLEVRWQGRNIGEILDLGVDEALELFAAHRLIARPLRALSEVGLGYLRLGQPGTALSGGEAQRVKLASELLGPSPGTLYLLDEPTTGLHLADVEKLLAVLGRLVDRGSTVVLIEHNPDLILAADHVIDLGPEGGEAGGRVIASGTPEAITRCASSHTGRAIRDRLTADWRSTR